MKSAAFAYVRPAGLAEAVGELATADGGGKVIAGGQSLTPVLAMRLARPDILVDLAAIAELDRMAGTDSHLEIGATVSQRRVEIDAASAAVPLLGFALPFVGHRELRSRGTVCGSIAHADPAAELPAIASCLNAELHVAGPAGTRVVQARDFFYGAMATALDSADVLTMVRFPVATADEGFGFGEIARRHGDFALAGVVARVRAGAQISATLTGFGISDRPVTREVGAEFDAVRSSAGTVADLTEMLASVTDEMVDTEGDAHASRDYRLRLFRVLACRELMKAYQRSLERQRSDPL
ncbi:FAD binding domain-containing protein [Nocardia brasiliensis]|uniref:FAD binding domain-containing protein n=1 Tax=Nocardia brasiliensis TaxID=37326 RepID=UPI003D8D23FF